MTSIRVWIVVTCSLIFCNINTTFLRTILHIKQCITEAARHIIRIIKHHNGRNDGQNSNVIIYFEKGQEKALLLGQRKIQKVIL